MLLLPSSAHFLTCHDGSCLGGGGHALTHGIVGSDVNGVHLATFHVGQRTVGVSGVAGDPQALLRYPVDCIEIGGGGHVPPHLADSHAVACDNVPRDARL